MADGRVTAGIMLLLAAVALYMVVLGFGCIQLVPCSAGAMSMSRSEPTAAGPDPELSDYERKVLAAWTDTHKKSALMLFILLALSEKPRWSGQIRDFITDLSDAHLAVDEQSMHRALRRVEGLNLITHSQESVVGTGAKRKIHELTSSGERVLAGYLRGPMAYVNNKLFRDATAAACRAQPS